MFAVLSCMWMWIKLLCEVLRGVSFPSYSLLLVTILQLFVWKLQALVAIIGGTSNGNYVVSQCIYIWEMGLYLIHVHLKTFAQFSAEILLVSCYIDSLFVELGWLEGDMLNFIWQWLHSSNLSVILILTFILISLHIVFFFQNNLKFLN